MSSRVGPRDLATHYSLKFTNGSTAAPVEPFNAMTLCLTVNYETRYFYFLSGAARSRSISLGIR